MDVVRKAEFAWASIAGADPEPVEIIEDNGRKGVLTTGCEDPFWLDDTSAQVVLICFAAAAQASQSRTQEAKDARQAAYLARTGAHGWRGPR